MEHTLKNLLTISKKNIRKRGAEVHVHVQFKRLQFCKSIRTSLGHYHDKNDKVLEITKSYFEIEAEDDKQVIPQTVKLTESVCSKKIASMTSSERRGEAVLVEKEVERQTEVLF